MIHSSSYVTSSSCNSSTDSSSSQHHPYAYTTMTVPTAMNKPNSLLVDSTSHLTEMINVPSSSILESTTATTLNSNHSIQQLSSSELINNDNVYQLEYFFSLLSLFLFFFFIRCRKCRLIFLFLYMSSRHIRILHRRTHPSRRVR
jgi:hypothetical protein